LARFGDRLEQIAAKRRAAPAMLQVVSDRVALASLQRAGHRVAPSHKNRARRDTCPVPCFDDVLEFDTFAASHSSQRTGQIPLGLAPFAVVAAVTTVAGVRS
jgi:hypothetical protein